MIANGVLFALATGENAVQHGGEDKRLLNAHPAVLKALDMKTGKELFNSGSAMESWVHFSGLGGDRWTGVSQWITTPTFIASGCLLKAARRHDSAIQPGRLRRRAGEG